MTPGEQQAFQYGLLLGALAVAAELQPPLAELDTHMRRIERELRPPSLRLRYFFKPAGWYHGRRMFYVTGYRA